MWPQFNVTMNDVILQDPKERDDTSRLTIGSVRADMTLASVWSGHPQVTELVITRPVLHVPLLRERAAPPAPTSRPAAPGGEPDADAPTIDRVTVTDGAIEFSNVRDRVNHRIDGINANALISDDRKVSITGRAKAGEQPLSFTINATAPAGPGERQNIPVELKLEAPGALQAPLSAKAELRLNGAVVMINGVSGTLGDGAFNGWASADLASKPLVKLDLDFQRLDIASSATGGAPSPQGAQQGWSNVTIDLTGLNYVDVQARISAAEINIGEAHFAPAAIDGTLAGGVLKARFANLGAYGGQANGDLIVDASPASPTWSLRSDLTGVRALPLLRSARRFRQARRKAAGEARAALERQQPARHHVRPRRHGVRGVAGRRDPRPQRRADDALAHLRHAVGLAGGQGADHGPDATRRLVPRREGPGHDQRSQPGRPAGEDDRRRHRRSGCADAWRSASSRNWC